MTIITYKTPGLLPVYDTVLDGHLVAVPASSIKRLQVRKLQIVRTGGGSGCEPNKMGTGVFVEPLWAESPVGSGILIKPEYQRGSDWGWKARRGELLGIVTPELLAEVEGDPDTIPPGDVDDLCVLAAAGGRWAKGDTVAEALKGCGRKVPGKDVSVFVVHREAYVTDMGYVATPNEFTRPDRKTAQAVSGHDGIIRTLPAAEAYAAELIAKARAQAPAL